MSKRTVLSTMFGSLCVFSTATALGQVLENNTIEGEVRFSNMNPTVVALLQQLGMTSAQVKGTSTTVGNFTSTTTASTGSSPLSRDYELSAEAGAGGPAGITYTLTADANVYAAPGYTASGSYKFQPVPGVVLQPAAQQPFGVLDADIAECVGIVHIRFGTDATCNTPVVVGSGSMSTVYSNNWFQNSSEHYVLQLGGATVERDLLITTGTDPTIDTINIAFPLTMHPACDEVQEICIDMSPYLGGGGEGLGALKGPFDILGETEQWKTMINASNGPASNMRYNFFVPAEMPVANQSTWWLLPNMVPGPYLAMSGQTYIRTGRQTTNIQTPRIGSPGTGGPPVVQAGVTSDLARTINNGPPRYPFVMKQGNFQGEILLADPFVVNSSTATSMLSDLQFAQYAPGSLPIVDYTTLLADCTNGLTGRSRTSFDGAFDLTTGRLDSKYDQVLVNPYDVSLNWIQRGLILQYLNLPARVDGQITVQPDATDHLMGPGDVFRIDHRYCFNEVELAYTLSSGLLFSPSTSVSGTFQGTDWLNQAADYKVEGGFKGWPTGQANAAPNGFVRLSLPQGSYTLQPGAYVQAPGGGTSTATFASTPLELGCGQRIWVAPGLSVSASVDACAGSATPDVTGVVNSSGNPVDRIWYQVNGGAQQYDICPANCGADPTFTVSPLNAPLAACNNTIQVFASSGGQTVSVLMQTTWEDPSDEIDCPGDCKPPPPPPPPPTCAELTAEQVACSGAVGGYLATIEVKNNTDQPLAHFMIADPHVSPHVVTLPTPLQPGASTTVTVTVQGMNPGSSMCMNVGMMNEAHDECCAQKVCFDVPACCFSVEESKTACLPGEPGGNFTHEFSFVNRTLDTIEHVFIIPPADVTAIPDYFDVPSTPPGGAAHIGPVTFAGATPGEELCFHVGIHDEAMSQCCSEEICVTVPEPCEREEPLEAKADDSSAGAMACSVHTAPNSTSTSPILLGLAALAGWFRRRRSN